MWQVPFLKTQEAQNLAFFAKCKTHLAPKVSQKNKYWPVLSFADHWQLSMKTQAITIMLSLYTHKNMEIQRALLIPWENIIKSMTSTPTISILKTVRNKQACLTLNGQAEPNLRMWFHFYVVLGNEAVFPIELCLVPVLITFFIQNLKGIQTRRENSHFLFTLRWEAMGMITVPLGFVCKRYFFGVWSHGRQTWLPTSWVIAT